MEVEFNNVTVTVTAENPRKAYELLCSTLSVDGVEFETDTFDTHGADGNADRGRCTSELWDDPAAPPRGGTDAAECSERR